MTKETLLALVESLPLDVTLVDKGDRIKYYSKSTVFKHDPSEIGTKVQDCHSVKTHPKLNQILADFRSGREDFCEYWKNRGDKKILVRYLAVRDKQGRYLGCLEVDQDITGIQRMKGEKKLT